MEGNINESDEDEFYNEYEEPDDENAFLQSVTNFNMLNTNARSITPKRESFTEYLKELGTSVAFLTETWLSDSKELDNDIIDYELGTGYGLVCKNRP